MPLGLETYKMAAMTEVTQTDSAPVPSHEPIISHQSFLRPEELESKGDVLQLPADLKLGVSVAATPPVLSDSVPLATQFAPPAQDVSFSEDELSDEQFFDANE